VENVLTAYLAGTGFSVYILTFQSINFWVHNLNSWACKLWPGLATL